LEYYTEDGYPAVDWESIWSYAVLSRVAWLRGDLTLAHELKSYMLGFQVQEGTFKGAFVINNSDPHTPTNLECLITLALFES
jgi:hypothetical protein